MSEIGILTMIIVAVIASAITGYVCFVIGESKGKSAGIAQEKNRLLQFAKLSPKRFAQEVGAFTTITVDEESDDVQTETQRKAETHAIMTQGVFQLDALPPGFYVKVGSTIEKGSGLWATFVRGEDGTGYAFCLEQALIAPNFMVNRNGQVIFGTVEMKPRFQSRPSLTAVESSASQPAEQSSGRHTFRRRN